MKMIRICIFLYLFAGHPSASFAQTDTLLLKPVVLRLIALGDSVLKSREDGVKDTLNNTFSTLLDSILHTADGPYLSFYQVKSLSVAQDKEKKVKAITWMISKNNGNEYRYFGYLIYRPDANKPPSVTRLQEDKTLNREELEYIKCDSTNWVGCIYYSIVTERYKKKDYFLLLGWAPQSVFTTLKMVEPLGFTPSKVQLGLPLIKAGGKAKSRIVLEYNAQVTISLRFNEKEKMIVMDHLSSSDPRPEAKGMYQLYGPDLSYDGLKFERGMWMLQKDIDIRNK